MEITCSIPIRSYLKQFIAKNHDVDPFKLSIGKCHISAIIFESFKENFKSVSLKEEKHLNDSLIISMSSTAAKHGRFLIDDETIWQIDGRLDDLFHQTLFDFVTMQYEVKGDYYNGILRFMKFYEIDEEMVKFETLVKSYYRYRKSKDNLEMPKKIPTMKEYEQLSLFVA
jgi:hypothetical protein